MTESHGSKPALRKAEIVELGSVLELTGGIEIGNLKDQSRVGWRPGTKVAPKAPAKKTAKKKTAKKKIAKKAAKKK